MYERIGVLSDWRDDEEEIILRNIWNINLENLGIESCICPYDFYKRAVVVQALSDRISMSEAGIALRDLIGYRDFTLDGRTYEQNDVWPITEGYNANNEEVKIYDGFSDRGHGTSLIFGVKNLQEGELYVSHLRISHDGIKTLDIENIELARLKETAGVVLFPNAILYGRGDQIGLTARTTFDAVGHHDRIKILGLRAEAIGSVVVG